MIRESIIRTMDRLGVSQAELARRADYSRSALNAYLAGRRDLTASVLERIMTALGADLTRELHEAHVRRGPK